MCNCYLLSVFLSVTLNHCECSVITIFFRLHTELPNFSSTVLLKRKDPREPFLGRKRSKIFRGIRNRLPKKREVSVTTGRLRKSTV